MKKGLLTLSLCLIALMLSSINKLHAVCLNPTYSKNEELSLASNSLLLVTHASSIYDFSWSSQKGVNSIIELAKQSGIPAIYLQREEDDQKSYFYQDCNPAHFISSAGGNFNFDFQANHVISVGGHLELCQLLSIREVVANFKRRAANQDVRLTVVIDATYVKGYHISGRDSYYKEFQRFTYPWFGKKRKATLDDLLSIAKRPKLQLELLTRIVKSFLSDSPLTTYNVELYRDNHFVEMIGQKSDQITRSIIINFTHSNNLNIE
jgi:hypothetical protein